MYGGVMLRGGAATSKFCAPPYPQYESGMCLAWESVFGGQRGVERAGLGSIYRYKLLLFLNVGISMSRCLSWEWRQ